MTCEFVQEHHRGVGEDDQRTLAGSNHEVRQRGLPRIAIRARRPVIEETGYGEDGEQPADARDNFPARAGSEDAIEVQAGSGEGMGCGSVIRRVKIGT